MSILLGYMFQVVADEKRDLDKQADNLTSIPGVEGIEYVQGWFGEPSFWKVEYHPPEKWKGLLHTQHALDRAVKTRKVKNSHDSKVFATWMHRWQADLPRIPVGFYAVNDKS